MALVRAQKATGITRDITILDADGETITPGANDKVRARIGHAGKAAKLTVTSDAATANGSSFTKNSPSSGVNRLRLDASDLDFEPGTYSLFIDFFDNADAQEWKEVDIQILILEQTGGIIDASAVLLEMGLSATVTEEERGVVQQAIRRAESAIIRHLKYDPVQRTRTEYYPQLDHDHQSGKVGVWEVEGSTAFWRRVSNAASAELQLRHVPVRSITSLHIDQDGRFDARSGAFGSETLKTEGDDFWPVYDGVDDDGNRFCSDGVIRSVGRWSVVPGSVKVVYVAGYSDDEFLGNNNALNAHAIWETALVESIRRAQKMFYLNKKSKVGHIGALSNESLGDYSYGRDGAIMGKLFSGSADLLPESIERLHDFINYGYQIAG